MPLLWQSLPAAPMAFVMSCGCPSMQSQLCLLHQDMCCSSATPKMGHLQQTWQQTRQLLHLLHFSSLPASGLQEKVARQCLPSG